VEKELRGRVLEDREYRFNPAKLYRRLYEKCHDKENQTARDIGRRICELHKSNYHKRLDEERKELVKDGRYAREVETLNAEVPWLAALAGMHPNLYKFGVNAVTDNNPHASNRRRRAAGNNVVISDRCSLCQSGKQTLAHVLSLCPVALGNTQQDTPSRYLFRHDNILRALLKELSRILPGHYTILCDMKNSEHHYKTFPTQWCITELRPDLMIYNNHSDTLWIAELTSPMGHNMESKHAAKQEKYTRLSESINVNVVHNMPFEIGALGGISQTLDILLSSLGIRCPDRRKIRATLSKEALLSSKNIFDFRDRRDWPY
jgi:hypothetical protein